MIKIDIEMPIYCYDCPCQNGENGRCQISGNFTADKRPFDCPLTEVDKIPAADVQEVRHAKWVYHESVSSDEGLIGVYECSNCHAAVPEAVFDLLMDGFYKDYCGACGAKMEEEE